MLRGGGACLACLAVRGPDAEDPQEPSDVFIGRSPSALLAGQRQPPVPLHAAALQNQIGGVRALKPPVVLERIAIRDRELLDPDHLVDAQVPLADAVGGSTGLYRVENDAIAKQ